MSSRHDMFALRDALEAETRFVSELCARRDRLADAVRGCSPVCPCHGIDHAQCPKAKPCIGRCGRLTTAHETTMCGYCPHCASDPRWVPIA